PEGDTRIAGGVNRRLAVATKTARRAAQFHCCQRIVVFESLKFELSAEANSSKAQLPEQVALACSTRTL
ncbi:MAG: hypothetical protein ABJZ55_05000, partial [Fuerstiella sp.]